MQVIKQIEDDRIDADEREKKGLSGRDAGECMRTDGVADVEGDARRPVGVVHLLDLLRRQAPPVVAAHLVLLPLPGRGRRRRQGDEDDDERDEAERRCRSHA
jgi:hypothetical protein